MSVFVQQQSTFCDFSGGDSWVILSPIEQSIKRKIEAVGTPLKDWDIQINYGIKTGCNDAFIISTKKRNEILANCATEEEHTRTDELIRPILRGRDIKRYGYEWA
ncbi:MAG: type II restriction endonuclease, partial [Rikenellaceae bacterium]|nr:type II restriction endonuclease [Rikenellaceae bacterium]